ncbi:vomeronasal type-2 receptor 26-like [Gastrophryne carolinensis]
MILQVWLTEAVSKSAATTDRRILGLNPNVRDYAELLTIIFTVEAINEYPDLLPNITLGYIINDRCGDVMHAVYNILKTPSKNIVYSPNYACGNHGEVIGFINNDVELLHLLRIYDYPQITYGSNLHSNLLKTLSITGQDDHLRLEAIVFCLKTFGWNWVGIITPHDGSGDMEFQELSREMAKNGICIAYVVTMTKDWKTNEQKLNVIQKSTASVIIMCGKASAYDTIMVGLDHLLQNITFILHDTWTGINFGPSFTKLINCSLFFMLHTHDFPTLEKRLHNINRHNRPGDPILEDIYYYYHACTDIDKKKLKVFQAIHDPMPEKSWQVIQVWPMMPPFFGILPYLVGLSLASCLEGDYLDVDSYLDLLARLRTTFRQWVYGLKKNSYDTLEDLMVQDQFMHVCPPDLKQFVLERKPNSAREAAELADSYVHTRVSDGRCASPSNWKEERPSPACQSPSASQTSQKPFREASGAKRAPAEPRTCYNCGKHLRPNCLERKATAAAGQMSTSVLFVRQSVRKDDENLQPVVVGNRLVSGFRDTGAEVPQSRCSESCPPGYRKAPINGVQACCYDCVQCSEGEVSNVTDSEICLKCPDEEWPDERKETCQPKIIEYLSFDVDLLTPLFSVISLLGSVISAAVLKLFISFWDTPVVKANNRTVSIILLTSILLSFLCVFLFLGRPVDITCMLRQVSFGIFFTISVSCVLAKTIIVCIAFKTTKPGSYWNKWVGTKLANYVVLICSSVQVLICVIWLSVSHPYQEYDMSSYHEKIIIQCNEGSVIGFYIMLGYLGFLAAVSFVLAFMVRTLPDSFNEAKYITFSMLVFCSVWIAMIPAYLSTRGKYMVAVEIFTILTSCAGLLGCIFFPKLYFFVIKPELNTRLYVAGK